MNGVDAAFMGTKADIGHLCVQRPPKVHGELGGHAFCRTGSFIKVYIKYFYKKKLEVESEKSNFFSGEATVESRNSGNRGSRNCCHG